MEREAGDFLDDGAAVCGPSGELAGENTKGASVVAEFTGLAWFVNEERSDVAPRQPSTTTQVAKPSEWSNVNREMTAIPRRGGLTRMGQFAPDLPRTHFDTLRKTT